jgi:hypothetical protein
MVESFYRYRYSSVMVSYAGTGPCQIGISARCGRSLVWEAQMLTADTFWNMEFSGLIVAIEWCAATDQMQARVWLRVD